MSDVAPIWRPAAAAVEDSELTRYQHWLTARHGRTFADYQALWEWSTTDLDGFWGSLWEYFEISASVPYERVLGRRSMPGAVWFPGAELSYAEHVFRGKRDDDGGADEIRHVTSQQRLRARRGHGDRHILAGGAHAFSATRSPKMP